MTGKQRRLFETAARLTGAKRAMLLRLIEADGGIVTMEELLSTFPTKSRDVVNLFRVNLCGVRKALAAAGAPYKIRTTIGVGYSLMKV